MSAQSEGSDDVARHECAVDDEILRLDLIVRGRRVHEPVRLVWPRGGMAMPEQKPTQVAIR
jgi:hypothetical protein